MIWGEGTAAKYYLGNRIAFRRNSLVHEVVISFKKTRITFTVYRK